MDLQVIPHEDAVNLSAKCEDINGEQSVIAVVRI